MNVQSDEDPHANIAMSSSEVHENNFEFYLLDGIICKMLSIFIDIPNLTDCIVNQWF